jgi:hypothetical protein
MVSLSVHDHPPTHSRCCAVLCCAVLCCGRTRTTGPPEAPEPSSCVHRWKQPKGEGRFKATALVESLHFWGAGCQRTLAFEVMSEYDLAVQEFAAQNHMGDHKADGGSDDDGGGDELGD